MTYNILKITISRRIEDMPEMFYSFDTDAKCQNIEDERKRMKSKYQADKVFFSYVELKD